jgi:hypothetical protein
MNHRTTLTAELDQIEDDILYEVSDEALEAAAGGNAMAQTVTVFYLCAPPTSGQWCPV